MPNSDTISLQRARITTTMVWVALLALFIAGCTAPAKLPVSEITFLYTTNTRAFIEPCGCCAEQTGGLATRAMYFANESDKLAQAQADLTLLLDSGGFSDNTSSLKQIQSVYAARGMELLGYDVVNLGVSESVIGQGLLAKILDGFNQTKVVSANLKFEQPSVGEDFSPALRSKVMQFVRQRVGQLNLFITGVTASNQTQHLSTQANGIVVEPIFESLAQVFGQAKSGELVVVLVNGLDAEAKAEVDSALSDLLAIKACAGVIVGFGEIHNKKPYPEITPQDVGQPYVTLLNGLDKGRGVSSATVNISAKGTLSKVKADFKKLAPETPARDSKLQKLMAELVAEANENDRLQHALQAGEEGFENYKYIGSRVCRRCHMAEFKGHAQSRHYKAYETLRHEGERKNAMCLPCHTVGYGEAGGFLLEIYENPAMRGVGCESCHGAGTYHRKMQYGQADGPPPPGANRFGFLEITEQTCLKCHTTETDLTWDYEAKLPLVNHSGREDASEEAGNRKAPTG